MNNLSLQEQALINRIRLLMPYERIEIMKDAKGDLPAEIVVFRAAKEKITILGQVIPTQIRSKAMNVLD